MTAKQTYAIMAQRAEEEKDPKRRLLMRYELRLLQLSQRLTLNDWCQIRTADYWKEKERIQAQEIPEIDKDIQEREALGLRIAEYLRNFKM
ncbi:hypothetical protein [Phaeodactylibacter xiamenensis]|uniref:hypothetical protein n=1 Tax=Phaeodactylibacter xiamenensis TaxID=1524460 RepID=UPI0024A7AADC|nr:hypothetical protein [Phaeodactylibacter xiamenensis]